MAFARENLIFLRNGNLREAAVSKKGQVVAVYPSSVESRYSTHKYSMHETLLCVLCFQCVWCSIMKGGLEYLVSIGDRLGDYVNLWIAVVDEKIVAKGSSAKEVFLKAKQEHPEKVPFVMKVPSDTVMVM